MAEKYTIDQITAASVADALRDRLGTDNLYSSADWAHGILDIPSGGGELITGKVELPRSMALTVPLDKIYNHILITYDGYTSDIISPGSWSVYGIIYNRGNIGAFFRVYTNGSKNNNSYVGEPTLTSDGVRFHVGTNGNVIAGTYTYWAFD